MNKTENPWKWTKLNAINQRNNVFVTKYSAFMTEAFSLWNEN